MKTCDNSAGSGQMLQAVHTNNSIEEDLIIFRWLNQQITNKKAISACLLVLQGIAYTATLPDGDQLEAT